MVEFITSYSFSQVPYITYEALDEYAEKLVRDFSPERLLIPGEFDILGFIQNYLGLTVKYYPLSYDTKVIGITAFHGDSIQVYDKETNAAVNVDIEKGTVVIDISLKNKRSVRRYRFTLAHEGSHWLIHQKTFSLDNPFGNMGMRENKYLAAKQGSIDYSRSKLDKTDKDRMERQADFLGAAILIPRPALRIAYRDFFNGIGEKPRVLNRGKGEPDDYLAKQLAHYIADKFVVSYRAALIRLEKLNAVVYRGVRSYAEFYKGF
jgi:Zn-dependent peptidase ImmA (M78 family)